MPTKNAEFLQMAKLRLREVSTFHDNVEETRRLEDAVSDIESQMTEEDRASYEEFYVPKKLTLAEEQAQARRLAALLNENKDRSSI